MKMFLRGRGAITSPAPIFVWIVAFWLLSADISAATALFDPKRGAQEEVVAEGAGQLTAAPVTRPGASMERLRLDGVLTIGDDHRILLVDAKGGRYRFQWRGKLGNPMRFEGEGADELAGYQLVSAGDRSVWLRLPSGTACTPDPGKGIMACKEGKVQLALVRRAAPPPEMARKINRPGAEKGAVTDQRQRVNPFTGQPLNQAASSDAAARNKRRIQPKKSQAQFQSEALKKEYRENARRAFEELARKRKEGLPPGFKASTPLFGQSAAVEAGNAEKIVKPGPTAAELKVRALKEQYRQRSLDAQKQGGGSVSAFGRVPTTTAE